MYKIQLPFTFQIPFDFVRAELEPLYIESIWMPASEVGKVKEDGSLPVMTGWMTNKWSENVGYDIERNEFTG